MKYNMSAKVYSWAFSKILKSYYKKEYPSVEIKSVLKNINNEYKQMVQRTPAAGNGMDSNLVGACWFFSLAKCMEGMNPDLLNKIVEYGFSSSFMQKLHAKKKKSGFIFSEKTQEKRLREALESQNIDNEMGWKYTYIKGKNEFYCTYTKCGICRLAEREHMEKYLKCMCHMDFSKFNMMGGKLIRTKTLADGNSCCDFHVVRIQ